MPNPRSFRVSDADMGMMEELQEHFPYRFKNISQVHREALRRGLLSIAAEASSPELPGQWGGLRRAPLVAALRATFAPLLAFLGAELSGAPQVATTTSEAEQELAPEPPQEAEGLVFDTQVVKNLQQLGSDFDDEDLEG